MAAKPFIPENSQNFDPHEYQGTISDLTPGQKYTFQIQAKTKIKGQKMPFLAFPVPARSVLYRLNIFKSYHIFFLGQVRVPDRGVANDAHDHHQVPEELLQ